MSKTWLENQLIDNMTSHIYLPKTDRTILVSKVKGKGIYKTLLGCLSVEECAKQISDRNADQ
jgi:hypothetical protein